MESIGQILKAARESRQISVADVSVATKMTSTYVKAIEADDFGALVAPVYARGFIKLYADFVGLDPMPLLRQFDVSYRAASALAPLPSKTPPKQTLAGDAGKLMPKPKPEKAGGRSKSVSPAALATAAPLRGGAHLPMPGILPSWLKSLCTVRLSALNRLFSARAQWPRFNRPGRIACNVVRSPAELRAVMPARNATQSVVNGWAGNIAGRVSPYFSLPAIVWRRIFIVAGFVLLIIAASLAWEWSHLGLSATTDACRWLAEPPAPYLSMEDCPVTVGR
ncbi:MAG: helix-turn-helix domain-containing protein [Verrucomicrobiota bacterium]